MAHIRRVLSPAGYDDTNASSLCPRCGATMRNLTIFAFSALSLTSQPEHCQTTRIPPPPRRKEGSARELGPTCRASSGSLPSTSSPLPAPPPPSPQLSALAQPSNLLHPPPCGAASRHPKARLALPLGLSPFPLPSVAAKAWPSTAARWPARGQARENNLKIVISA